MSSVITAEETPAPQKTRTSQLGISAGFLASDDFSSFDAKYVDGKLMFQIPYVTFGHVFADRFGLFASVGAPLISLIVGQGELTEFRPFKFGLEVRGGTRIFFLNERNEHTASAFFFGIVYAATLHAYIGEGPMHTYLFELGRRQINGDRAFDYALLFGQTRQVGGPDSVAIGLVFTYSLIF